MSSSSSTAPAERRGRQARPEPAPAEPSRGQTLFTWALLLLWLLLLSFGAVSAMNPPWLQRLSSPGIDVEAGTIKGYGDTALRRGEVSAAIAAYQDALRIKPGFTGARVNLAIAHGQAGDPGLGVRLLREALEKESVQQGVIHYNLAQLLEKQGKREEAAEEYRRALGTEVEEEAVLRSLGLLHLKAREWDAARQALERTLLIMGDPTTSYRNMLQRSVAIYAEDPETLPVIEEQRARGVRPEDLEPYDLETLRQAREASPELSRVQHLLGALEAEQGEAEKAAAHLETALRIWPGNADAARDLQAVRKLLEQRRGGPAS